MPNAWCFFSICLPTARDCESVTAAMPLPASRRPTLGLTLGAGAAVTDFVWLSLRQCPNQQTKANSGSFLTRVGCGRVICDSSIYVYGLRDEENPTVQETSSPRLAIVWIEGRLDLAGIGGRWVGRGSRKFQTPGELERLTSKPTESPKLTP